jgi:hypothetical protein
MCIFLVFYLDILYFLLPICVGNLNYLVMRK